MRGMSCCELKAPVPLLPPKKSPSTWAPAVQSLSPSLPPAMSIHRRVLRRSPPLRLLWAPPAAGTVHSAFWPLPKLKFWSCQKKVESTKPCSVMLISELVLTLLLTFVSANVAIENNDRNENAHENDRVLIFFADRKSV